MLIWICLFCFLFSRGGDGDRDKLVKGIGRGINGSGRFRGDEKGFWFKKLWREFGFCY